MVHDTVFPDGDGDGGGVCVCGVYVGVGVPACLCICVVDVFVPLMFWLLYPEHFVVFWHL